jgi:hypothetical protein
VIDVDVPDPLSDRRQDPRDKSGAKARYKMHELEKRMIDEFAPKCGPGEWTIIDGGVRKGEFVKLPRTIGVAKSFDRTPTFTIRKGNKGTTKKDISLLLSTLPSGACGTAAGASLVAGRPSPSARVHAAAAATAASVIIKPRRVHGQSPLARAPRRAGSFDLD